MLANPATTLGSNSWIALASIVGPRSGVARHVAVQFLGFLSFHQFFHIARTVPSHSSDSNNHPSDPFGAITVMIACFNWEEDVYELGKVA
jgi:hypothetical protein